tara:strand:+ start:52 stop:342 length:291 start_codon:yes stop_codon:yes gene_type:complete
MFMALNFYRCPSCEAKWGDHTPEQRDAQCKECGKSQIPPYFSTDDDSLTSDESDLLLAFRSLAPKEQAVLVEHVGKLLQTNSPAQHASLLSQFDSD